MDDKMRAQLRKKIESTIEKFQLEVIQLREVTKPISPENSIGRVSRMDAINNKSVMEAALRKKLEKLGKLIVAQRKLEEADFGTCSSCGNPISEGRLMFMPESDRCVRCADRL